MTLAVLLLAAALGHAAERQSAPAPVGLHPLLLGDPAVAASPLSGALLTQAADLQLAARGTSMPASMAAAALAPALAHPDPLPRAAALVSARLMAERGAADFFFSSRPELRDGPVGALPGLAYADDSYRGSVADRHTPLGALAAAAAAEPAVAWLFDGSRPGLGLDDFRLEKGALRAADGRLTKLAKDGDLLTGPHPGMPGALLTLVPFQSGHYGRLQAERELYGLLGEVGAGPRWLGHGSVHPRESASGFHVAGLRESVEGQTVQDLLDARRYTPADHALVQQLLHRLVEARVSVSGLGPLSIVLGRTAADPVRRAYVVGAAAAERMPEDTPVEKAIELVHETPVFVGFENGGAGGEFLFPPVEIHQPLSMLLRGRAREPQPGLWERAVNLVRRRKP